MGRWSINEPQRLDLAEPFSRVDIRLISGRLNVVGGDAPARLEVTAVGRQPIIVTIDGDTLTVRYERPPGSWIRWTGPFWWLLYGRRRFHSDVSVAVPPATAARLRLVSGDVVASGLRDGATVEVTSGRVTLLGLAGRVFARLVSGPIEALGVGGELTMETVSGELLIADSTAGRVYAKTVSGSITADLDNPPHHSEIWLETVSGPVTARVREDSDLDVSLRAVSGRITSGFPQLPIDRTPGTKRVSGVLGRGTGQLRVDTTSGNIALLRREVDGADGWADQ